MAIGHVTVTYTAAMRISGTATPSLSWMGPSPPLRGPLASGRHGALAVEHPARVGIADGAAAIQPPSASWPQYLLVRIIY